MIIYRDMTTHWHVPNGRRLAMRNILPMALSIALGTLLLYGQARADEPQQAKQDTGSQKEQKEKLSYSLGYGIGGQMKKSTLDLDLDIFSKALRTGLVGDKATLTDQEMRDAVQSYQQERQAKLAAAMKELAEQNKHEGEAFLAVNATKEDVVTRPSGLQYKIIKAGTGKSPNPTDKVTVKYRSSFVNGREFDSSYKRNKPVTFRVDDSIAGWNEGIQMMKEGAKWQFFIPANLAYGEKGTSGKEKKKGIPPNTALIFDVELIAIEPAPAKAAEG
jgi:FKBP-type peptidyl-prolyl cis-trans isomerase FklB